MKLRLTLFLVIVAALSSAAAQSVPLAFSWDDPGPQYSATNLMYVLHYTTNSTQPQSQWQAQLLTNVFKLPNGRLGSTNSFPYDNWFFAMTWTNVMWKTQSFFSNVAVPDRLPPSSQPFNLGLQGTP